MTGQQGHGRWRRWRRPEGGGEEIKPGRPAGVDGAASGRGSACGSGVSVRRQVQGMKPRRDPARRLAAGCLFIVLSAMTVFAVVVAGCGANEVGDGGPVSLVSPGTSSGIDGELGPPGSEEGEASSADLDATAPVPTTSGSGKPGPTTYDPTLTPTPLSTSKTLTLKVYLVRDEKIAPLSRVVPRTLAVGTAVLTELLNGPAPAETRAGISSCIPPGTALLGLSVADGVATVDLSREFSSGGGSLSMTMRLAQVVFTLTQFPTVDSVRFRLDGEPISVLGGEGVLLERPVTRQDYEEMSPAILVESPTWGATVGSPLRVTGTANVFEAVFRLDLVDTSGKVLVSEAVKATAGTGTRGLFDVTVTFATENSDSVTLQVYTRSPKDGKPTDMVAIPLRVGP